MSIEISNQDYSLIREEADGTWFWSDEIGEWHGPHSSEKSARDRQVMYAEYTLGGCEDPELISKAQWQGCRDSLRPDALHGCTYWQPWFCDCGGACSCHWKQEERDVPYIFLEGYPIEIEYIKDGLGYFLAYLPDFGHSACSAPGDTIKEAIENLRVVKRAVMQHYKEVGREIPKPSSGGTT